MEGVEILKTIDICFSPSAHNQITLRQNDVNYMHTKLLRFGVMLCGDL